MPVIDIFAGEGADLGAQGFGEALIFHEFDLGEVMTQSPQERFVATGACLALQVPLASREARALAFTHFTTRVGERLLF